MKMILLIEMKLKLIFLLINLMSELKPLEYYIDKFNSRVINIEHIKMFYKYILSLVDKNQDIIDYENANVNCENCENCYMCVNCINCINCINCEKCNNCEDCNFVKVCNNCEKCINVYNSNNCEDCNSCFECNEIYKCYLCYKCEKCYDVKDKNEISNLFPGKYLIYIKPKTNINTKYLNSYLSSISNLYKDFNDEGLFDEIKNDEIKNDEIKNDEIKNDEIKNDNGIIKNIKRFEIFNKIDSIEKLDKLISIIIDLYEFEPNNEFIKDMLYNIGYLQLKECIEVLVKNDIIKYS